MQLEKNGFYCPAVVHLGQRVPLCYSEHLLQLIAIKGFCVTLGLKTDCVTR